MPNTKLPSCKWTDETNYFNDTTTINLEKNNIGLPTGTINNIIVLDIDVKDNGLSEWNNYLKTHVEPQTITVKTPSGGYHYYFNLKGKKESDNYLIDNYLKTKSKFRNYGLDIRANGGYVVFPPSQINNKAYEFVRNFDEYEHMDMPTDLIYWLLEDTLTDKQPDINQPNVKAITQPNIKHTIKANLIYNITDDQIVQLLGKLDKSYVNSYSKWLIITTILKSLNKFDIWNNWSKKGNNYDVNKNIIIWNNNKGNININYLIHLLNDNNETKLDLIQFYKPYEPLTQNIEFEQLEFNNRYVSNGFTYEHLINNNTIIIKSCTGSGKTTAIAKHIETYLCNSYSDNNKIISIVSKISLAQQHIKSFDDNNIKIISYDNDNKNLSKDNITICINSLLMYQKYEPSFFNNKIVFIDEINSFIESLTHNETLDKNIKIIYQILIKIVKNCHKLIVCDALISDNVLNL